MKNFVLGFIDLVAAILVFLVPLSGSPNVFLLLAAFLAAAGKSVYCYSKKDLLTAFLDALAAFILLLAAVGLPMHFAIAAPVGIILAVRGFTGILGVLIS